MKKVVSAAFISLIMFGMSASASWYWQQTHRPATALADPDRAEPSAESGDEHETSEPAAGHEPLAPTLAPNTESERELHKPQIDQPDSKFAAQSSFASGDDTVQLAASLRERMTAVRERENQLMQRQAQVDLILKDIRDQRVAIEELRKQVNQEFVAAEEQLAAAQRERTQIEAQQQSLEERVTEVDSIEKEGTKRLGSVYDGMAADRAAEIIEHMVNAGNMDTAVKLLGSMRERQAAKVLGEFQDTSLAAQLSEKLKGLKKPVNKPKG
jgi:flagellar motility protein MotE (MotC chaperone)